LTKKQNPIFFGWWIVIVTGIISGLGHGFNSYGISVFFKDLAAELNLSRAITSLATGLGRLEGGAISPFTGWLSDKFGPKWPIVCGICIAATGMILMNFITEVWHYFVVWGVLIGFGINLGLTVAVDKSLNDWFLRKRGLAHGNKFAIIGVVGIVVIQIITPIILTEGWRITCLIWGMVMFVSVPFAFAFVRNEIPERYGLSPDGIKPDINLDKDRQKNKNGDAGDSSGSHEVEYTFKQTIKIRSYWILVFACSVQNLVGGSFVLHVIPFLSDLGIDPTAASFMMGIMVFFTIPARFFGGITADRFRKNRIQFLLAGVFFL
jgi:cyanate permease